MKRLLLLFALPLCFATTSCLKDGFNDFESFNHDIVFEGEISPDIALPIGHGTSTIHDLLSMVQETESYVEVDDNGVIVISYSTDTLLVIDIEESKGNGTKAKDGSPTVVTRGFNDSYAIDLFEQIDFLNDAQIEVDSILVNFFANVSIDGKEGTLERIKHYDVSFYFNNLSLEIKGEDGNMYHIYDKKDSIPLNPDSLMTKGQYIKLFDRTDISTAVNKRIKELHYSGSFNICVGSGLFGCTQEDFLVDSLGLNAIDIDGHLDVRFPLSAYIDNLSYNTDIDVSTNFDAQELVIDSSHLYIDFYNGIPLALNATVELIDSAYNKVTIVDGSLIKGSPVKLNNSGQYVSDGTERSRLDVLIDKNIWEALQHTKKINLSMGLSTSTVTGVDKPRVTIRDTDLLSFNLWALLRPSLSFNSEDGNINMKGGAQ